MLAKYFSLLLSGTKALVDWNLVISFFWYLGTITKGAALLHQEGAREVYACTTHAVFRYVNCVHSIFLASCVIYCNDDNTSEVQSTSMFFFYSPKKNKYVYFFSSLIYLHALI